MLFFSSPPSIYQASCLTFLITIDGRLFFLAVTTVTVILSLITAILITLRVLYFSRYNRKAVEQERNEPYMTIMIICVKSSALVVVFSLTSFIQHFQQSDASLLPIQTLVNVFVSLS